MRIFVAGPILAAALCGNAVAADPQAPESANAPSLDMPSYSTPPQPWTSAEEAAAEFRKECADRIRQVREETGKPTLDKNAASDDEAELIWAVDRREGKCPVMVMKGDIDDVRPVPDSDTEAKVIPADQ